jgi:hypothetical protein
MESEAFFQEKVYLTPNDISREVTSIDAILLKKIKERLEQKCSPHGYVLPGTLELLTRSAGMVDSGRFSGDWAFLVKAKGRVLHPPEGTSIELEVLNNNKMGVYGIYENAIRVMIPRDLHLGDEEFDQLKVGERIRVEIQKSRFQLRDPFIVSVGLFRGMATGQPAAGAPVAGAPVATPVEEEASITNNGKSVLSNVSVREQQETDAEESEAEEGAESEEEEEEQEE